VREPHGLLVYGVQPFAGVGAVGLAVDVAIGTAQFMTVQAGGGEVQGREEVVELVERAAADEGDGTFEAIADAADGFADFGQQRDRFGVALEFDEGAIHVEEQRTGIVQQWRRRTRGEVVGHACQHAIHGVIVRSWDRRRTCAGFHLRRANGRDMA